jgi:hypothetical protein
MGVQLFEPELANTSGGSVNMSKSLSTQLCAAIAPLYKSICEHPFINELANGSLRQDRFVFYLQQDALD